ncbi:hypothetical protein B0H67DRAFT_550166 [Lasiosphaeris hirsuta]|uniref:Uncharacterized protein n=1 Tax=Lasiosphaeris hirsuta TaxID=260670 RepID=A0AA40E6L5_9PEZI|nr:hypothetical protein B0H67DRAFT_550166 [Lasiosphaeris hirsuta]
MAKVCVPWGTTLTDQRVDKRRRYAWPHDLDEGVNLFRLDDHIWVWRALKSLEDLDAWEVLGRFTTVNDVSRRRMLAVTRSARETRLMFHARDTVLFYSMDWGFPLNDGTLFDVWEDTVDAQSRHDGNQETSWDNAIRYALAVLMGSRGYRINKRQPEDLATSAFKTLLRSTGRNPHNPAPERYHVVDRPLPGLLQHHPKPQHHQPHHDTKPPDGPKTNLPTSSSAR